VPGGTNIYDQFTAFKWLPVNIIEKNNGLSTILEQNKQYFYDDKITFERDIHGMLLVKNSMSYLLELDITINLLINKKVHFDGTTVKNYEIKHGENFIVTYDIGKVLGLDNILSGNHAFEQDIFFDNYGEFSFFMEPKDSKNTVLIRNMTGSVQAFSLVILEGY
jgi:hypothetical protein